MKQKKYNTPIAQAVWEAYADGEDDEIIKPILLVDKKNIPIGRFKVNDGLIFANIRGEREVELTMALTNNKFPYFPTLPLNLEVATMIEYHPDLPVKVAFSPTGEIANNLTEYLSMQNMKILKCVESEKAIHLTYFFNGKKHFKYPNEDRIIIPSHETENLAEFPEMKTNEVANSTIDAMRNNIYNLIVTNLSPCDVMGHIEDKYVVKNAIKTVDKQLSRIVTIGKDLDYTILVTADHGLAEKWLYPDGTIDTGHTDSPVPCLLISKKKKSIKLREGGSLIDIAPTILELMGMDKPQEMEGISLVKNGTFYNSQKILLLILDGWGHNPNPYGNLFMEFGTPNMDDLKKKYTFTTLVASGIRLGMPKNTVGNSEIGHLHMGAGRRVVSDRVRILEAIENESFFSNPTFLEICNFVKKTNTSLHILGIISFYSSHGSVKFLDALMKLSKNENVPRVFIHGMLGRRGEKPEAGSYYVNEIEKKSSKLGNTKLVSIIGRHWALDREQNWDRIEKTYNLLVHAKGKKVSDFPY